MLFPTLIAAPTDEPITLAEAKMHLRETVSDGDELLDDAMDAEITAMIKAAVAHIDGFTGILGRAIMPQTWSQEYDGFCGDLVLPLYPVRAVASVNYGADAFTDYRLLNDGRGSFLRPNAGVSWPSTSEPVVVEFEAGYADAASVPYDIKQALKLHVGTMYHYRESYVESGVKPSKAYDHLLSKYRMGKV